MALYYLVCDPSTDVISWTTDDPAGSSKKYLNIVDATSVIGWQTGTDHNSNTEHVLGIESATGEIQWLTQ